MNIKKAIALAGLVAATANISPLAFAQDSGWYLGASGGQSIVKDSCPSTLAVGVTCDDRSSAYSIFGGYQFNKYLGAELGYNDLGEVSASDSVTTEDVRTQGVELLGVGTIPITAHLEIYGKVGAFFWNLKDSCNGTSCLFSSQTETGTALTYGLGAQYNFAKTFGMRLQYQQYQDIGNVTTTGETDIDLVSLGILIMF